MIAAVWCHFTLLVVHLLTIGVNAYSPGNAPIRWMCYQAKSHAKPLVLAPEGFAGHWRGLVSPQKLTIQEPPEDVSPNTIPYFKFESDESIVWGDMGWCISADEYGNGVRIGTCTGAPAQKWNWIPDGLGRNRIQLKNTNRCLAADNEGGFSGTLVVLRDCQNEMRETWKLEEPIAFLAQNMSSNHAISFHIRHVLISAFALAGAGALSLGAWFWQTREKQVRLAAVSRGSIPVGAEQETGLSMIVPLAISEGLNDNKWWNRSQPAREHHGNVSMCVGMASPNGGIPHEGALFVPQQRSSQLGRRALLATTAVAALPPFPAMADDPDDLIALGTVRIKPGKEPVGATEAGGALYVTVRVIPANNVGTYVTAGKVPPLATARFASPITFPFEVQLRSSNLTPEYAGVPRKEWQQQDLIMSARWDIDGTAVTRGPDDLVGRGLVEKFGKLESSEWRRAEVVLEGRGLTGRLLMGGK